MRRPFADFGSEMAISIYLDLLMWPKIIMSFCSKKFSCNSLKQLM